MTESFIGKEGKGIPADVFLASKIFKEELVDCGSGAKLKISINPEEILIEDPENNNVHFIADLIGNSWASFSIRTRKIPSDPATRHPDLYAGRLFHASLDYFERTGHPIDTISHMLIGDEQRGLSYYFDELFGLLPADHEPTREELTNAIKKTSLFRMEQEAGFNNVEHAEIKPHIDSDNSIGKMVIFTSKKM